jgi:hypothetical protein
MAKLYEVSAEQVRPEFMEVQARGAEADKAVNDKVTSKFLQDARGTIEINAMGGGMKRHGVHTTYAHEAARGGLPGAIMSTATSKVGTPISDQTQLRPDSMVSVGGTQCTLEVATRMGLVSRGADGTYVESTNPASVRQQNPAEALAYDRAAHSQGQSVETTNFMDPAGQALLDTVRTTLGPDSADTVIVRAFTSSLGGGNPEPAVNELASAMQIEPGQAAEFLEDLANNAQERAAEFISNRHEGVSGWEVLEWAGENLRPSTKASLMAAIYHGAVPELDRLVQKYRIKERF